MHCSKNEKKRDGDLLGRLRTGSASWSEKQRLSSTRKSRKKRELSRGGEAISSAHLQLRDLLDEVVPRPKWPSHIGCWSCLLENGGKSVQAKNYAALLRELSRHMSCARVMRSNLALRSSLVDLSRTQPALSLKINTCAKQQIAKASWSVSFDYRYSR